MTKQAIDFYSIHTLTNLHAGSGDATYGIVDNMIQRDPTTGIPVIHASSLKGAIRQYYREANGGGDTASVEEVKIFGSDTSPRTQSGNDFSAGSHLFFEARLLVLPVRSDRRQFFRAVCPELIQDMVNAWTHFGYSPRKEVQEAFEYLIINRDKHASPVILSHSVEAKGFTVEDWDFTEDIPADSDPEKLKKAEDVFGKNLILLNINDFKSLCTKLPVIARNQLENGLSQNLFYEEVAPRECKFFTFIMRPEEKGLMDNASALLLDLHDKRIQIGAGATIGNGQCNFHRYTGKLQK